MTDTIPIADPELDTAEKTRVEQVIDSGLLADGPVVREFEDEFAAYCGADHGVATTNGTTALHAAFEAIGISDGDQVITTPFSFIASANAIRHAGGEPVFVDIDPRTYNLDPDAVETRLANDDGSIVAILAVHLYGLPADLTRLQQIADEYDVMLVEDAAQAHGATVAGDRVGSIGDVACFSFYPTKNMTTGEGGMITTDDETIATRARRFANHGRDGTYKHVEVGQNYRMTSVAAAIGRGQLEKLSEYNETRQANATRLTDGLENTALTTPTVPADRTHVYHQYTVRTSTREDLQAYLDAHDIGYGVYYPLPIHEQPAYENTDVDCPEAERAAQEVLSLPVHPNVSQADCDRIIEVINQYE